MNKGQALALVYGNPGKRYRDKEWGEGEYIYVNPETGMLFSEEGPTHKKYTFLGDFFETDLNIGDWEEWTKPKVVANGLAELFAKDDGKMKTWVGENGTWYFIDRLGYLKFVNHPNSNFPVDQLFLHQKFTLLEKEDRS